MSNIIKRILGNESERIYIPHECAVCGEYTLYRDGEEQNYLYHNGKYYHSECFMHKPKRGRRK
jgi:hypothetical protein